MTVHIYMKFLRNIWNHACSYLFFPPCSLLPTDPDNLFRVFLLLKNIAIDYIILLIPANSIISNVTERTSCLNSHKKYNGRPRPWLMPSGWYDFSRRGKYYLKCAGGRREGDKDFLLPITPRAPSFSLREPLPEGRNCGYKRNTAVIGNKTNLFSCNATRTKHWVNMIGVNFSNPLN